jgi:tetratricopeptide (TPR) repeat protein
MPAAKLMAPILIMALILTPVLDVISGAAAYQDKCGELLKEAETKYREGLLDETIALVNRCLDEKGLSLEESEDAYKLLGKAYHAKGLLTQSKENLRKLLELIPNWQPNPDLETPSFIRLAEEVIKEMEQQKPQPAPVKPPQEEPKKEETKPVAAQPKKKSSKTWLFVAGGGLVAGGLVLALAGGGGGGAAGGQQLPSPPVLPPNP